MEIVEGIGWLAIVCVLGFWFIGHITKKDNANREVDEISKYSDKCIALRKSYASGNMSHADLQQKLRETLKEPDERRIVMNRIQELKNKDIEREQEIRNQRKIGYKYEEEIFEIFDTKRKLPNEELVVGIQAKFNLSSDDARKLLDVWYYNELIKKCYDKKQYWEVGRILNSSRHNIDDDDLTREKWLAQNGKTLEPESNEYLDEDDGLPF